MQENILAWTPRLLLSQDMGGSRGRKERGNQAVLHSYWFYTNVILISGLKLVHVSVVHDSENTIKILTPMYLGPRLNAIYPFHLIFSSELLMKRVRAHQK